MDSYDIDCNSREVLLDYTVYNNNSTDPLPANTPIAFYADDVLIGQAITINEIPIDGSESNSILLIIPESISDVFVLSGYVDDDGTGQGVVNEIIETNNMAIESIELISSAPVIELPGLMACDAGFNSAEFDLTRQLELISDSFDTSNATFYNSLEHAQQDEFEILTPASYTNTESPQTIYIRLETSLCYQLFQFEIEVENCPPFVPQGFSPNEDGYNDWFNIQGLYDIFENHELLIYNRFGTLIFKGNNETKWDGKANQGLNDKGKLLPVGTYFYVLHLNDPNFNSLSGWVYLNR